MDNQDDLKTQPTATAIMERLQSMETRLLAEIGRQNLSLKEELIARFDNQILGLKDEVIGRFDNQILSLNEDLTAQITRLTSKIEVLNEDILSVRGAQREILKRLRESDEKIKAS
jgi:archaellum component FlaC